MPAYLDPKTQKWYCRFYYEDVDGNRCQKMKRGFELKREALAWERDFLMNIKPEDEAILLPWSRFVDKYNEDTQNTISAHTLQTRTYIMKNHISKAFKKSVNEITPNEIQNWTNGLSERFSLTHSRNIYKQMRAVFNHAMRLYGLHPNPCQRVRPPVKREVAKPMVFWTYDEFSEFILHVSDIKANTAIKLLYWSGIRKGELLALLWSDIEDRTLSISKSYQRLSGESVVTPPKTSGSVRELLLPKQALDALRAWKAVCPATAATDPVFSWEKRFIEKGMEEGCRASGMKRIRVHDLRHSHASYLISKGANIKLVSKRLGHEKTSITLDTYSHLFPSDEQQIIDIMEKDNILISI